MLGPPDVVFLCRGTAAQLQVNHEASGQRTGRQPMLSARTPIWDQGAQEDCIEYFRVTRPDPRSYVHIPPKIMRLV